MSKLVRNPKDMLRLLQMSRLMRKPTICIGENKDADQLRGNREADQRLCFRYTDSTIPLLFKSKILSLLPSSVTVQPGLCRTCSETTLLVFPRGGSNICCRYRSCFHTIVPEDCGFTKTDIEMFAGSTFQNLTGSQLPECPGNITL